MLEVTMCTIVFEYLNLLTCHHLVIVLNQF